MCDGCGCTAELERCFERPMRAEDHGDPDPFLMVVTDVDEESQIVTLMSVYDWEVPCKMEWYYGHDGPCGNILDKVGHCFEVTLTRKP